LSAVFFFFLFNLCAAGQELISSGGANDKSGTASLSWSIGESVIETFTNANSTLTQGFQQSKLIVTSINELPDLTYAITVFPNPASEYVILKIGTDAFKNLTYQLADINGKFISQMQLKNTETEIPLNNLPPSVYILNVSENKITVKSFKVIKK